MSFVKVSVDRDKRPTGRADLSLSLSRRKYLQRQLVIATSDLHGSSSGCGMEKPRLTRDETAALNRRIALLTKELAEIDSQLEKIGSTTKRYWWSNLRIHHHRTAISAIRTK
ncbi:MAG: hypothetical protein ACHQTE_02140 [Candidatus Saccharimonadales bacterium]